MNGLINVTSSNNTTFQPEETSMFSALELFRVQKIVNEAILSLKKLTHDRLTGTSIKDIKAVIRLLEECKKQQVSENTQYLNDEILERDFYKRLLVDFPSLTICERRLCLLTLLHLSTKDISDITRQSIAAVNKSRLRLRKKLGITGTKISLLQFLDHYRG